MFVRRKGLNMMLRTQEDLILHFGGEPCEIIAVAADSHDEIPIRFGIFSCVFQRFSVGHVDLQFEAASLHIDADQALQDVREMISEHIFGEFDVDGNAADQLGMIPFR